jgi:adenosylmethionine-8-amino-7-oxononanoate aminotransferase
VPPLIITAEQIDELLALLVPLIKDFLNETPAT